jgi:hypothetical protein
MGVDGPGGDIVPPNQLGSSGGWLSGPNKPKPDDILADFLDLYIILSLNDLLTYNLSHFRSVTERLFHNGINLGLTLKKTGFPLGVPRTSSRLSGGNRTPRPTARAV